MGIMTLISKIEQEHASTVSKVKGPIRCHKCQLKCRDAEHYLNHKCEPGRSRECTPFSSMLSSAKDPD